MYAIRQRLTPFSFVLLSFLLFRVTLSAKDLWRKGARFHTGSRLRPQPRTQNRPITRVCGTLATRENVAMNLVVVKKGEGQSSS